MIYFRTITHSLDVTIFINDKNIHQQNDSIENKLCVMAHKATTVTRVKYPAQQFSEVVAGIQDARDVNEFDTTPFFPILDSKVLDINMSSTFSRNR